MCWATLLKAETSASFYLAFLHRPGQVPLDALPNPLPTHNIVSPPHAFATACKVQEDSLGYALLHFEEGSGVIQNGSQEALHRQETLYDLQPYL